MPRRAAFCKSSILVVTPIASRCLERLGVTASSAPTTIGTTFALTFQSRATSLRRSWYFSTFSFSFSTIPVIIIVIIIIIIAELQREYRASEAPLVRKIGNPSS